MLSPAAGATADYVRSPSICELNATCRRMLRLHATYSSAEPPRTHEVLKLARGAFSLDNLLDMTLRTPPHNLFIGGDP